MYCDDCDSIIPFDSSNDHQCTGNNNILVEETANYYITENKDTTVHTNNPMPTTIITINTVKPMINSNDDTLHQTQRLALKWCAKKARIYHKSIMDNVIIRFLELDLTRSDLQIAIDYIRDIDPIVHFGRTVDWLKTENKMKNCFEIGSMPITSDNIRIKWEHNLFGGRYFVECEPNVRVKYGCLNLMSDDQGCRMAHGYGRSYMIIKPELKSRITFVCGDSSGMQSHICTFDHFVQLFLYLDPIILKHIINMAKYKKGIVKEKPNVNLCYMYIEMQIHGDIDITKDVDHIMLSGPRSMFVPEIVDRLHRDNIPFTIMD